MSASELSEVRILTRKSFIILICVLLQKEIKVKWKDSCLLNEKHLKRNISTYCYINELVNSLLELG